MLKIIIKLKREHFILKYRDCPEIAKKFDGKYNVNLGFGLNIGWAIEGAIGSLYKIDCTYLS